MFHNLLKEVECVIFKNEREKFKSSEVRKVPFRGEITPSFFTLKLLD